MHVVVFGAASVCLDWVGGEIVVEGVDFAESGL